MMRRSRTVLPIVFAALFAASIPLRAEIGAGGNPAPDFAKEIRPILEQNCFGCHGPDQSKGGLRLHTAELTRTGGDSGAALVPGDAEKSLLWRVVAGLDEDMFMPAEGDPLTDEQVLLIRRWIDSGAEMPEGEGAGAGGAAGPSHWAYQPVRRPPVPPVKNQARVRNPVDAFILSRLEERGIEPSPQADRATLIRRLHLDLTGLLPTPSELRELMRADERYLYSGLAQRLMASPHFGERQARPWLDLARYADSDGYEKDTVRPDAWRYRHWVIDAYNRDKPYDQFVIEQVAGDLIPEGTPEQAAATGFHRNTLTNKEGGIDPEEDRVKQTVDRANTTGEVFLGLTFACAQCHSHKYDAISHREYFSLYAFFNSATEASVAAPFESDWLAYRAALREWEKAGIDTRTKFGLLERGAPQRAAAWESSIAGQEIEWSFARISGFTAEPPRENAMLIDGSVRVSPGDGANTVFKIRFGTSLERVTGFRVEILPPPPEAGEAEEFEVADAKGAFTDGSGGPGGMISFVTARATTELRGSPASNIVDIHAQSSWKPERNSESPEHLILRPGFAVADAGAKEFELTLRHKGTGVIPRFRVAVTDAPAMLLDMPAEIREALNKTDRDAAASAALLDYYKQNVDPEIMVELARMAQHAADKPVPPAPTAPSLAANPKPPVTRIHIRGNFLQPGDEVTPGTPAVLPPLEPRGDVPDRLDLARWIASPDNPLTARVEVNRIWERLFGRGLVDTPGDFGVRGTPPSHPELLDWLADEFMASGWSRKHMFRLITDSATYRQSSAHRPDPPAADPGNVLLWRQERYRVPAEVLRDITLGAAGLLNPMIGGPSIRPPLPEGVADLGYARSVKWVESTGEDRYRRGLYIHFQRTVPYPMLMAFDCPDSNVTNPRRQRSNTPIQSLTLMNDPVFTECAVGLARRTIRSGAEDLERIAFAFGAALGRAPDPEEEAAISALLAESRAAYGEDSASAASAVSLLPGAEDAVETAAWTVASRVLLNLDEFMTRE